MDNEGERERLIPPSAESELQPRRGFQWRYTIELPLFLISFGVVLAATPLSNIIMYRTCTHTLGHTVGECHTFLEPDSMNHTQELENEVQKYVTMVNAAQTVIAAVVPAALSLFLGVWSDKYGRKPLLVWTFLGMTFNGMLSVVYSMVESLGPWWYIVSSLPCALTGGFHIIMIGAFCFIKDITDDDNRSFRLTMLTLTNALAQTTATMLCPYIVKWIGNVYLLLLAATLYTLAYAFTMVIVEESLTNIEQGSFLSVLKLSHIKEMAIACFSRKPDYGRAILLLSGATCFLSLFLLYGENGLLYMYTREHLHWTMKDFTMFSSISTGMWFVGAFVGVAFIQKWLRISDLTFTAISFMSCVVEYTVKTVATTTWLMYLGSALSLFGTVYAVLIRSFLSKTLPSQDIAKVFGFLSFVEAFCPLLAPLVYNSLYEATISTFPGSILVLTAGIYAVCFILTLIIKCITIRINTSQSYDVIRAHVQSSPSVRIREAHLIM
ncbi:probable peptidoglycan muropeptide transporter SLC46 isoform X1 [Ostrinia nubilalis]|uniref:probable peptidoglycan muropeptide transporter SLC46 isoform X1 n=1 Tax=Ostrinia nubilalis TaxID=29057 RepID=UPI0030824B8C